MTSGDRFVWYGEKETVIGTIVKITERTSYDLVNGIKITKKRVIDQNGVRYDYNQCFRVDGTIKNSFLHKLVRAFS